MEAKAKNFYEGNPKHYLAVDCIIFGFDDEGLKLLLINRKFEPCKGQWSLMGGFVKEEEDTDDAARRVLFDLAGLEDIYLEQLQLYGKADRDPGARVASAAYFALIRTAAYDSVLGEKHGAKWFKLEELPQLIFDHNDMVHQALDRLRMRARHEPVGFELLPGKFTLPQLQLLYEAIYQTQLDKRNFRRRILAMGFLIKLDEKDRSRSRKGAYCYKFDRIKFNQLGKTTFLFEEL